jgi:hypothetical protein
VGEATKEFGNMYTSFSYAPLRSIAPVVLSFTRKKMGEVQEKHYYVW